MEKFRKNVRLLDKVEGQSRTVGQSLHFLEISGLDKRALAFHQFPCRFREPFSFFEGIQESDPVHQAAANSPDSFGIEAPMLVADFVGRSFQEHLKIAVANFQPAGTGSADFVSFRRGRRNQRCHDANGLRHARGQFLRGNLFFHKVGLVG